MLGSMGMQDFVIFPMVGFLEEDIGANACFFELTVIFHGCRGDVDIDAANSPVFMFDTVNSMDTFKNVFNRIVDRVLACFKGQALVPHILQGRHFPDNFFLRQFLPGDVSVLGMIGTVDTPIDTVV